MAWFVVMFVVGSAVNFRPRKGRFEVLADTDSRFSVLTDLVEMSIERNRVTLRRPDDTVPQVIPLESIVKLEYDFHTGYGTYAMEWFQIALVLDEVEPVPVYIAGQGTMQNTPVMPGDASVSSEGTMRAIAIKLGLTTDMEEKSRLVLEKLLAVFESRGRKLGLA